jgi:uncharacterized protein YndB with AHSA1/START domain
MPADRIEREIQIDAPIDVVWTVLTEAEHIASWFADSAELDLRPGGQGVFVFEQSATSRPATVNLRIEQADRPRSFSLRWGFPDGADPDATNSLLAEFTLEPAGDATRLRLVESGFTTRFADTERARQEHADHEHGWDVHLTRLREYAADQRGAIIS